MNIKDLDKNGLYFIPLGGSEEFGVNLNAYIYQHKIIVFDCGIGFADSSLPGVDILLPDPSWLEDNKEHLLGLVITHAHEDHIGAVPYLWPRLRCPIYCTSFTAAVLRNKFKDFRDCRDARIEIIKTASKPIKKGPFSLTFYNVAHSIPDAVATMIETKAGNLLHSGDWNLDPTPVLGQPTDEAGLKKAGDAGILAYIGDSTNAAIPGRAGSEQDVAEGLEAVFKSCPGRIVVTMFASNISRVHSIAKAAQACGRDVGVVGRSLHRMTGAAKDCGYLKDIPNFISDKDIGYLPDEKTVIIATGSQGEPRAALSRMAFGTHPEITLHKNDTVIFSARAIPGNEKDINKIKNSLIASGIKVIDPKSAGHTIHVSGHPYKDELIDMFGWVRPETVICVHGERMQLEAQAEVARECQIPNAIVPQNGSVIQIAAGSPKIIDHIETRTLAVEPKRILDAGHRAIAARRKLQYSGVVHATLVMDARGDLLTDPKLSTIGLIDPQDEHEAAFEHDLLDEIEDILADMTRDERMDDQFAAEQIRIGLRRYCAHLLKLKPQTHVHLMRV